MGETWTENKISAKYSVVDRAQPSLQAFPARSNPTVSGDVTGWSPRESHLLLPRLCVEKGVRENAHGLGRTGLLSLLMHAGNEMSDGDT